MLLAVGEGRMRRGFTGLWVQGAWWVEGLSCCASNSWARIRDVAVLPTSHAERCLHAARALRQTCAGWVWAPSDGQLWLRMLQQLWWTILRLGSGSDRCPCLIRSPLGFITHVRFLWRNHYTFNPVLKSTPPWTWTAVSGTRDDLAKCGVRQGLGLTLTSPGRQAGHCLDC